MRKGIEKIQKRNRIEYNRYLLERDRKRKKERESEGRENRKAKGREGRRHHILFKNNVLLINVYIKTSYYIYYCILSAFYQSKFVINDISCKQL